MPQQRTKSNQQQTIRNNEQRGSTTDMPQQRRKVDQQWTCRNNEQKRINNRHATHTATELQFHSSQRVAPSQRTQHNGIELIKPPQRVNIILQNHSKSIRKVQKYEWNNVENLHFSHRQI
jgi:hypothetical protein